MFLRGGNDGGKLASIIRINRHEKEKISCADSFVKVYLCYFDPARNKRRAVKPCAYVYFYRTQSVFKRRNLDYMSAFFYFLDVFYKFPPVIYYIFSNIT